MRHRMDASHTSITLRHHYQKRDARHLRPMVVKPNCPGTCPRSLIPDLVVCAFAPPNSSCVTSSFVTAFTTSGPVTNRYDVSRTMKVKSVKAGEYTAPPAHGPMTSDICGTTPEARTFFWRVLFMTRRNYLNVSCPNLENIGISSQRIHALLNTCSTRIVQTDHRCPDEHRLIHDLFQKQILNHDELRQFRF